MNKYKLLLAVFFSVGLLPLSEAALPSFLSRIEALQENQWGLLSTNSFQDAWPEPQKYTFAGNGGNPGVGPYSVINAWSSFAWDSKRDQIIIYGGGHANYAGNEIYLWDGDTGSWGRGSLPSEVKSIAPATYVAVDGSDNAPTSAHTYDNNVYLPIADRFVVFGGAAYNTGGGYLLDESGDRTGPYFWDPSKADPDKVGGTTGSQVDPSVEGGAMWENRHSPLPYWHSRGHTEGVTAYAEEGGKDVVYVDTTHQLWKYKINDVTDSTQDEWELVGDSHSSLGGIWSQGAGAIDAESRLFVRITGSLSHGGNRFIYYDLSVNDLGGLAAATEFTPDLVGAKEFDTDLVYAGIDYDPNRGQFLIWDDKGQLWALREPETLGVDNWELRFVEALPTEDQEIPNPSGDNELGILGKWEYASAYDVFLGLYDATDGGVWAYKPENWSPSVSLVPIPAGLWLFVSAITFLATVHRRRHKALGLEKHLAQATA